VTSVERDLPGDAASFVVLGDGTVVLEEGDPRLDAAPLAASLALEPPFRAEAVRRADHVWALGARRIETLEIRDDPGGSEIELVWDGFERSVTIDGSPTLAGVPELDHVAAARYRAYVASAIRLSGSTWEVSIVPL
jgi:hypothetical protein